MKALALVLLVACASAPAAPREPLPSEKKFAMRQYTFVVLKRGPAWTPEKTPETKKLFEGHMANIKAMAAAKKLLIAGPFDDDPAREDAIAGIFIFDPTDPAVVNELLSHDPAIAAGRLKAELHLWFGPAGLTYDGIGHESLPN